MLSGEYTKNDVSSGDVYQFLGSPLEGSSASLLHWTMDKVAAQCYGEFYGYPQDKDKKRDAVLEVWSPESDTAHRLFRRLYWRWCEL